MELFPECPSRQQNPVAHAVKIIEFFATFLINSLTKRLGKAPRAGVVQLKKTHSRTGFSDVYGLSISLSANAI
jgi:hypothetical protein